VYIEVNLNTVMSALTNENVKYPHPYRRTLLESNTDFPRAKAWLKVLDTAAEKSGWGKNLPKGTAMGIAIGDGRRPGVKEITICAVASIVSVSRKGDIRVERFDVAMDTGSVLVNPLAAERQIEMQMVMGLAAVLRQEITIEKGRTVQSNFHNYPLLRATEMPEIKVHFVRSTDDPIFWIRV